MDQSVRNDIDELRALAASLAAILKDAKRTVAANEAGFADAARAINALAATQDPSASSSAPDAALAAIVEMAHRIEHKASALANDLGGIMQRVAQVESQANLWRERALQDQLTGLPNRRSADAALAGAIDALRTTPGTRIAVAIADIDRFKSINDTHGHIVGDAVIRFVALTLRRMLRAEDFVARWGGEEFLFVLPNADLTTAHAVCERIRKELDQRSFKLRDSGTPIGKTTISIGLTELHKEDDPKTVTDRADKALYTAKANGRNQVVVGR